MKLRSVEIRDFRGIQKLDLDLTDGLLRPLERALLVGPNASGKTTILDAIAACLGPALQMRTLRPDLHLTPRGTVRRGAVQTQVACVVQFDDDEIQATRQVYSAAKRSWTVPEERTVRVEWQYPYRDRDRDYPLGYNTYSPRRAWTLFQGRSAVAESLHLPEIDFSWFSRVGGCFTFDQQRTGMGKVISRYLWEQTEGGSPEGADAGRDRRSRDPRMILVDLALKSSVPSASPDATDGFAQVRDAFAHVCRPHRLVGPVRDEVDDYDVVFADGDLEYRYDGLSSGEQMVLLFLLRFVTDRIHKSVVLVDEVELHQHPLWQRKLLSMLSQMGSGNQFIIATHSPYLRDIEPREHILELGNLGDASGGGG